MQSRGGPLLKTSSGPPRLFFSTSAILAEEVCARDLRDMLLDHDETGIERAVIVAALPVRLARYTIVRCLLVGDLLHKNDGDGRQRLPQRELHLVRRLPAKPAFFPLRIARDNEPNQNIVPGRCWYEEDQPRRSNERGQASNLP